MGRRSGEGRGFNPLWLSDGLGVAAVAGCAAALTLTLPAGIAPWRLLIAQGCVVLAAAALVIRVVSAAARRRERRRDARAALLERLRELHAAMSGLSGALTQDAALRLRDAAQTWAAAGAHGQVWLSRPERELAARAATAALELEPEVSAAADRRDAALASAERLTRELRYAASTGVYPQIAAEVLTQVALDATAAIDEPVRTDRNLDHFGRLSANRRTFESQAERQRDEIGERVERFGRALFDTLAAEVHAKIGIAERVADWQALYGALDPRLSGLASDPAASNVTPMTRRTRPAGPVVEFLGEPTPERPRLKAAND